MKLDEALYYLAFSVYYVQFAIEHTMLTEFLFMPVDVFTSFTKITILLLLFFKFVTQRASFKCWVFSALVVLIGLLSWRQSGEGWFFWLVLFVVCANGVRLLPLAKIALALTLAILAVTVSFACCGVIENKVSMRQGGAMRYAMGFTHPNTFALYLINLCVAFSVVRFGKNPAPDLVLIALVAFLNLAVTNSRTAVALSFLQALLLLAFYSIRREERRKTLRYGFLGVVLAVIAMSFYFMVAYNPSSSFDLALNDALSGRLRLANGYYEMQPLTLFGSDFEGFAPIYWENGVGQTFVVDNGWCHFLLRYGVIPTIIYISGYLAILFKMVRTRRWDALFFGLVLMCVFSLSETLGIRIECNYFLYAIGAELLYADVFVEKKKPDCNRVPTKNGGERLPWLA